MERRIELGTRNKAQRTGNGPRRKGDDIAERLLDAVEGVRQLLPGLRLDAASKHVAKQLWRATTGGGANYEEARGAERLAASKRPSRRPSRRLQRPGSVDVPGASSAPAAPAESYSCPPSCWTRSARKILINDW